MLASSGGLHGQESHSSAVVADPPHQAREVAALGGSWRVDGGWRPHLTPGPTDLPRSGNLEDSTCPLLPSNRRVDRSSRGWQAPHARALPRRSRRTLPLPETREGLGAEAAPASADPGENKGR